MSSVVTRGGTGCADASSASRGVITGATTVSAVSATATGSVILSLTGSPH